MLVKGDEFAVDLFRDVVSAPVNASHGSQPLVAGSWIHRGPKTVIGNGMDRVVSIARSGEKWTLTLTDVYVPSVDKRAEPTRRVVGPFDVSVKDHTLSFVRDGKQVQYTFRLSKEALLFPAFIKTSNRTWVVKSPLAAGEFACESNPFEVPVGKASFPSVGREGIQNFYVLEQGRYDAKSKRHAIHLKFMVRMKDGALAEASRLTWNRYCSPRFYTRGGQHRSFMGHCYLPLKADELKKINDLPMWPGEITPPNDEDKALAKLLDPSKLDAAVKYLKQLGLKDDVLSDAKIVAAREKDGFLLLDVYTRGRDSNRHLIYSSGQKKIVGQFVWYFQG